MTGFNLAATKLIMDKLKPAEEMGTNVVQSTIHKAENIRASQKCLLYIESP